MNALLQALADPENLVPLVATLRGIFFGFSDDLLYRLWTKKLPPRSASSPMPCSRLPKKAHLGCRLAV